MNDKKFKIQLKKLLPAVLQDLISDGTINIVKVNLVEDKATNLVIRIKPGWNRPIKKDK